MKLLIVESPAKAKTISKYLDDKFTVRASVGHIRDLPKSNKNAIDIDGGFVPSYETVRGKEKVISELKSLAKKSDEVLLATDPDREGEAIAWHIQEALGLKNLDRIVFNEITKPAVNEAIGKPRKIDMNLKEAQEARRVLDRLFGYDLSGLIWKKLRYGLSAGRVQSPALRILVEKEKEIRAFKPEEYWVITADFEANKKDRIPFHCSIEPKTEKETDKIIELANKSSWTAEKVTETEAKRSPKPPFTTSTLQQAASSRLGFSPSKTMVLAQHLYEDGQISYIRTDSTNLSKDFLPNVYSEIKSSFGDDHLDPKTYSSKSKNAQEAHEAIRPTDISKESVGRGNDEKRLYELVRARTLASQMTDAKTIRTKILARASESDVPIFSANGSRVTFNGWLAADPAARGEDTYLPEIKKDDPLKLLKIEKEGKETQPPPRFTEAGLVKELEKRGIGRPSTYAPTIKTIVDRGYVEKEGRALHPTDTGEVVSDFLSEHFENYISDSFTAQMEDDLDNIANGEDKYEKVLSTFYKPFTKEIASKEKLPKISNLGDAPADVLCPECGKKMIIKLGRTGKFLSCSDFPECIGARKIDGSVMEPPKEIGEKCPECADGQLVQKEGRFGMFIACSNYPKCKHAKQDGNPANDTGVQCPLCKKGNMSEKRGRFGPFFGCTNYPACKHIIKTKPTGAVCGYARETSPCTHLMMEGTKTIPQRCSDKTCPNHNPHKLDK